MEDKEEQFVEKRDLVEYHASFIEPEAIRKVREARDSKVDVPHDEFVAGIEHLFGRKVDINRDKKQSIESTSVDPKVVAQKANSYNSAEQNKPKEPLDYSYWLNMNLE